MGGLVSILIPCWNAARWVRQAIESALAQTWVSKEIIVADDGSSDGSLEIVKSFGDKIRWETGPNRGGNAARNRLTGLAKGEWLQYLDADDYLLPDKIARQMAFLAAALRRTWSLARPSTNTSWKAALARLSFLYPNRTIPDSPGALVFAADWSPALAEIRGIGCWRVEAGSAMLPGA